jgi:hypothetical protein
MEGMVNVLDIREQFIKLDLWPCSALDKKKEIITVSRSEERRVGKECS